MFFGCCIIQLLLVLISETHFDCGDRALNAWSSGYGSKTPPLRILFAHMSLPHRGREKKNLSQLKTEWRLTQTLKKKWDGQSDYAPWASLSTLSHTQF